MGLVDRRSVERRLEELKLADPTFERTFGAGKHRFTLAPPLAEDDVAAFERLHGITLPATYRDFLLTVGSSGAGPGYGLTGLPREERPSGLAGRGPLTEADAQQLKQRRAEGEDDAFAKLPVPGEGVLRLCEQGCGWESYLIVSGVLRGAVWVGGDLGWFPEARHFAEWYEAWLREPLAT